MHGGFLDNAYPWLQSDWESSPLSDTKYFNQDPEQQQSFKENKQEIVRAVALRPVGLDQILEVWFTSQPGNITATRASGREHLERLKVSLYWFWSQGTEDMRSTTP